MSRIEPYRVGLLMNLGQASMSRITKAIRDESANRNWIIRLLPGNSASLEHLDPWQPDAVIARVGDVDFADALNARGLRVLNISSYSSSIKLPRCTWNDDAIGRLAAEPLLERGFRVFVGTGGDPDSAPARRCQALRAALEAEHAQFHFAPNRDNTAADPDTALVKLLQGLSEPVAVFAANSDSRALELCDACLRGGLRIPEDVAILGVGNTPLICEMSHPSLSSVQLPAVEVGKRAVQLMHRWLTEEEPPPARTLLRPQRVVTRMSTDIVATSDELVAKAIQIIRERACEPLRVRELVAALPISRRPFEKRFLTAVGRTPLQQIHRVQIRRAMNLLSDTNTGIYDIALMCGFSSGTRLAETFVRLTGKTPSEYRRSHQEI